MLHLLRIALFTLLSLSHVLHASSREPTLHYFLDTHGHLTIEDLVSNSGDVKFAAATDLQLVVGFSRYPVWLKLQLPADNEHNTLKIDGFLLQQIDWYQQIDHPSAPTPPLHQSIQHPHLHTNTLAITPGVNSTVWIRLTADSAIQVAVALTTASPPHAPVINNLSLLVFAFTLSLGFVGVILHTQSQYQRLSLLSLQSLLLVCSGLNLPSISTLGYTDNALTGGLLLTFFMHLHHSAREQTWWSVRQLRIVRFLLTALLIANLWPSAPLTSTLLLLLGVLSYALWAPFAHMQRTSSALKIRLRMIMPDLFFWFICVGLLGLHLGLSPHPQQSAMVWSLAIFIFSLCLALMQIRTFIDEHRLPTNMSHAHLTDREAFKTEVFKNFAPQPILANSALLPQVKSGMRQVDSKERLHDHLSVIQQESRLQPTPEPTEAMFADTLTALLTQPPSASLQPKAFNLRILGHEILQQLENITHRVQSPLLFAIKPGTHTHFIGAADALMSVLQQLAKHSLQMNTLNLPTHLSQQEAKKRVNTISVRIEDEILEETDYAAQQHPVLLKSHLRDNSCLNDESIHWLNQTFDQLTESQITQLQSAYPYLFAAKHLVEQLHGKLHIHPEGAATTCYSVSLTMHSVQNHQPEPPQSFLTLKDKKILLMTYDGEYGMTMTEQASGQDIPMSLALSISQARRNLQYSQHTDAQFDLLVLDCSQAEEALNAFISEIHSAMPGYAQTPLLLLHQLTETLPHGDRYRHATKPSAFVQLGALITSLFNKPL